MPLRSVDWMREVTIGAGALALLLGLLLWSGIASAACPHEEPGAAVSASAGMPHAVSASSHGRHAPDRPHPDRSHKAVPPCCTGMACITMLVGLPGAEATVPVRSAGLSRPWAAVMLREGLGLRPDLPPPRLG